MRVLVVGSGAREHALVWKLARESSVKCVIAAPGNPGIAAIASVHPLDAADPEALLALARREHIDLTVVGPELPLARGLVDRFASEGLLAFGPTAAAARLETSKTFAKDFMSRQGVPTAGYRACDDVEEARGVIRSEALGFPVVVKADGLAAGKGVSICANSADAERAIDQMMVARQFGAAGSRLVIEEFLSGEEASFFALCDGRRGLPLLSAQDHKRAFDDDAGPNTGGMGAFAPSPRFTPSLQQRVMSEVVEPVLAGMEDEGHPFRGFLYVGLMLASDGPKVVEFNVRFGDPEAQVILPMMASDLAPLLAHASAGALPPDADCRFHSAPHVGVVMASGGYPGACESGKPIAGLERAAKLRDVLVFHAGTAERAGRIVTNGGRVLTVVGRGSDYRAAIDRAYEGVAAISFEHQHVRTDIGRKALTGNRESGMDHDA